MASRDDVPLQLVFSGECLDGHDPLAVRRALADALKLDSKRAARLFSGKPIVLRRGVDALTAERQVARFAQLGALLHTEPSRPRRRTEPGLAKGQPATRSAGAARRRRRPWILGGLILGLALALGIGLNVLWPETGATDATAPQGAALPAPMPGTADGPGTTAPADHEMPKDMTAEALRDYRSRYLAAPRHKAFAISSRGAHAWHAGAASENEAREAALAGCMQAQPPSEDGCRVVDANGTWEE